MPVDGMDFYTCVFENESVHLSLVSRLPSQIVIKSYNKFDFDEQLSRALLNNNTTTSIKEFIQSIISENGPGNVVVNFPTTMGFVEEYSKVPNFSEQDQQETGRYMLELASGQEKEILNYQILDKDAGSKWIFALGKRFANPIKEIFMDLELQVSSIILNTIANFNFIEAVQKKETSVLLDFSSEFVDAWFINGKKNISEWQLFPKNFDFKFDGNGIEEKVSEFIITNSHRYALTVDDVFYCGIKNQDKINQLFNEDQKFNLKECVIDGLATLSPEVEDHFDFKGNEEILIKIAGTTLS